MKLRSLYILAAAFISTEAISEVIFSTGKPQLTKQDYKYHECVDGINAIKSQKANLSFKELCKYGEFGCPSISKKEKFKAYCYSSELSECFEKKKWATLNQILRISDEIEPGLVTYGLKKGDPNEGKTCAYWNSVK